MSWILIGKGMIKKIIFVTGLILILFNAFGQSRKAYDYAFQEINKMLNGETQLDFKKAVFLTENAFYSNKLDYNEFCKQIDNLEIQLIQFMKDNGVVNHPIGKQFAIFSYMMEASKYNYNTRMTYDFEDLTGKHDWTKMFVSKLLNTKTGNCHSLPYLYKILAEELKAEAYLALGPNHMYIKHKDDKGMWVNLELTNGSFPRDGWIISSLSITTEAIKNGIYMEPLSLQESVSLTLYDLALGYQFQFGHDAFGLKCCDTLLQYFPKCVYGYMVKSEILAKKRESLLSENKNQKNQEITKLESTITAIYQHIDSLGYKDMPKEQYEEWVKAVDNERKKQLQK